MWVEERMIRSVRVVVECFKCGKEGHKCRKYPQWERKEKRVACPRERKAHQGERRPACSIKEKAQEGVWKRSLWEEQKKKAEWYCGPTVPQDAELWELG